MPSTIMMLNMLNQQGKKEGREENGQRERGKQAERKEISSSSKFL